VDAIEGDLIWIDLNKFNEAPISSLSKKAWKFFKQSI
jgi:hypothetical protein